MLGIFLVGFFLCMLIYKENFYYKCNEFIYDGVFELFNWDVILLFYLKFVLR